MEKSADQSPSQRNGEGFIDTFEGQGVQTRQRRTLVQAVVETAP